MLRIPLTVSLILVGFAAFSFAWADPPAPVDTTSVVNKQTFKGRTFEEWHTEYQTELDPEKRIVPLQALVVFGANGRAKEVMSVILELLDGYPPEVMDVTRELRDELDDGEYQKVVKGANLPEALDVYFLDMDDFKLYRAAQLGFYRLSHRTVPQLVELLETPGDRTTARLVALLGLARWSDRALVTLIPELIARDDQLADSAWSVWTEDLDPASYIAIAEKLLELPEQPKTLRAIHSLTEKQRTAPGVGVSLLRNLKQSSTDPVIIEAINKSLETIEKPKDAGQQASTQPMVLR